MLRRRDLISEGFGGSSSRGGKRGTIAINKKVAMKKSRLRDSSSVKLLYSLYQEEDFKPVKGEEKCSTKREEKAQTPRKGGEECSVRGFSPKGKTGIKPLRSAGRIFGLREGKLGGPS